MSAAPRPPRMWPTHLFRIATLFVPSLLAWNVAFAKARPGDLIDVVALTMGVLWVVLLGAFVLRTCAIVVSRRGEVSGRPAILSQIDVLTSAGAALGWLSALSIAGAVWVGWASLAVVGLLGTGLFHIVVLLTYATVRGADPVRSATISRSFVPGVVTEGDDVIEEIRLSGTRIPTGFRLFVTGRVGPRWATSRHVLDATESGSEIVLESEIGPAVRGEHDAEPLTVWLQDTFGICRSARVLVGGAHLTVLPRIRQAEETKPLLDKGEGPHAPRPASRLPTEGCFKLREYQQGDDVRRIHWMRSVAARELIVRLPDELPPDRPHVRLVLDTFFPEASTLACDTPSEMLDAIVGVWLAVAKSLAEAGVRVTLVAGVRQGDSIQKVRQDLSLRSPERARRFGAQVKWQDQMMVSELLTDEATFVVSRAVLAHPPANGKVRWIVVLPTAIKEPTWPHSSDARFPFPMGSSENRWTRRRREQIRIALARRDRAIVMGLRADIARPPPGSFVVRPGPEGAIRLEALP